jgi:hypothetical protein
VDRLTDPDAVLVVDETGDLKKGIKTVGVQRQYSGTAGRIENCQIAVYLSYVTKRGHAFIDRELYLPRSWMDEDPGCQARRDAAGVPEGIEFATKPELARMMILAALDAGVLAKWATADEVYGQHPGLRATLSAARIGYVLAVPCSYLVPTADTNGGPDGGRVRADTLIAGLDASKWGRYSAGDGAKGQRVYDWARIPITAKDGHQWLLARRSISTGELAYYHCYSPRPVKLATLVRVAGQRWPIEENFQTGKGQTGLDAHQVRNWISWYRWTILVMLAHAFLTALAATAPKAPTINGKPVIPLTLAEIRRLLNTLVIHIRQTVNEALDWSLWRRHHQATAKQSHYQRQQALRTQITKWEGRELARQQFLVVGRGATGTRRFPGELFFSASVTRLLVSSPRPSNRACGSPAHGLPTFFTGGIRFPGPEGPGRDDDPIKVDQAQLVGRQQNLSYPPAPCSTTFALFGHQQRESG